MICLDASDATKLILPEEYSDLTEVLFAAERGRGESVVAPALLAYEIVNVIRKRMVRAGVTREDAKTLLDAFHLLGLTLVSSVELHELALEVAEDFQLRAAYDAHYVALAMILDCELWTDDAELLRVVAPHLPRVRAISSYQPND